MSKPGFASCGERTIVADNFFEMADAILAKTRQVPEKVTLDDDPRLLQVGYRIENTRWRVRLFSISNREGDPTRFALYSSYVRLLEGRQRIAELWSKGLEPTGAFQPSSDARV